MAKDVKETKPAVRGRTEMEPWRFSNVEKMFEDWLEDFWSRPFRGCGVLASDNSEPCPLRRPLLMFMTRKTT